MRHSESLDSSYFEDMYRASTDPWRFETSAYEAAKYRRTLQVLGRRRYERALEVGCANGVLTEQLAPRCASLLAIDISATALAMARTRCADLDTVVFAEMGFPKEAPQRRGFDLVLLSEVVYYWDDTDLRSAAEWLGKRVAPFGDIMLVHWIGETDYPQSGDDATRKLRTALGATIDAVIEERHEEYRLDLWRTNR